MSKENEVFLIEPGDWETATGECVEDSVLVRVVPPSGSLCDWKWDQYHDKWDTSCGEAFMCINGDPAVNSMKFCPYCGQTLVQGTYNV